MSPTTSIIIVTYNSAAHIATCLSALQQLRSEEEREIIVVDNASRDSSAAIVRESCPSARLLVERENWGFAGGVNRGVAAAQGRIIVLLNPDALPHPDWLQQIV